MQNLNLTKGERVDLTKTNPGVLKFNIGMGWDANSGNSGTFDLDAFAIALKGGKAISDAPHSVLYFGSPKVNNKPTILNEALVHSGDNLTGVGDGDDETIILDISKLPADCDEVLFAVNIYQDDTKRQNFGMVNNAFIRVYDPNTPTQNILKFDLSEDYSAFTGVVFGKVYKKDGEWKFQAVGEGKNGDINTITSPYYN